MESIPSSLDQLERHCKQRLLPQSDGSVKPYCKYKNSIETKLKLSVECFETYTDRGTLRKHQSNAVPKEKEKIKCLSVLAYSTPARFIPAGSLWSNCSIVDYACSLSKTAFCAGFDTYMSLLGMATPGVPTATCVSLLVFAMFMFCTDKS